LENISDSRHPGGAGKWIETETFQLGDKTVTHQAGDPVGNTMAGWRSLREASPELFQNLRVWQSPTAFVDTVIWSWQQKEEAAGFPNLIRLVDSLRTHWTAEAAERNFLSGTMQSSVPAGCTPLGQVTDTGFAQPGKAAARDFHDELRSLLQLKARSEGAKVVYKVSCREILQTAGVMHQRFVSLNESQNTVLAEARACGWMHFRPDTQAKVLQPVASQTWSRRYPEGSSRMGPEFRQSRDQTVVNGIPVSPQEHFISEGVPKEQQPDYFEDSNFETQTGGNLVIVGEEKEIQSVEDQLRLQAALLHPRVRGEQERQLAQLLLCTSQLAKPKANVAGQTKAQQKAAPLSRAERALEWRARLGTKAVQDRLHEMVATTGKKKSLVKKALKKGWVGKASRQWKERHNYRKNHTQQKAKTAQTAPEPPGPLVGKTVRCIQATASYFWQNSLAEVVQHRPKAGQVQVRLPGTQTTRWMQAADVVPAPTGISKLGLVDRLNLKKLTKLQKEQIWNDAASQASLDQTPPKTELGGPELSAGWFEIFYRGIQAGDRIQPGEVVFLEPHALQTLQDDLYSDRPESQAVKTCLQDKLATARLSQGRCLIVAPIQGDDPAHWTSLSLLRLEGSQFTVKYQDSLNEEHSHCLSRANAIFGCLLNLGVPASVLGMPPTELTVSQGDSWSCGFHTLNRFEEQFRQFRGEGQRSVYTTPEQRRQSLNRLCQHLQEHFKPVPVSAPPPPPEAAGSSQAAPLPLPAPLAEDSTVYGCSRCRHAKTGCLACNPEKAVRAVKRQRSLM